MRVAEHSPGSLLIIELSGRRVTAALADRVADRHRLFATTEGWIAASEADPLEALGRAIADLELITARHLIAEGRLISPEAEDGAGGDAVLLTAGAPLQIALLAVTRRVVAGLHDPLDTAIAQVEEAAVVEDLLDGRVGLLEYLTEIGRRVQLDRLVLIGPEGSTELDGFQTLARALIATQSISPGRLPPLVLAAERPVRERFTTLVRQKGYRAVETLFPRFRECEPHQLGETLRLAWDEQQIPPAIVHALGGALRDGAAPRLTSLRQAAQALATIRGAVVWLADVSDRDVAVLRADPGRVELVFQPFERLSLDRHLLDDWRRRPWLVANHRSGVVAERAAVAQAVAEVAREIRTDERAEPVPGLIVGRGSGLVCRLPASEAALALALGLGIVGPVEVALDRHNVLAGAGTLLDRNPDTAADLIEDALDPLGTVVVGRASGSTERDGVVLAAEISNSEVRHTLELGLGQVETLAADRWTGAEVVLSPERSVDLGAGDGRRRQLRVGAGELGVIVTVTSQRSPRRWARPAGPRVRLPSIFGRW